MKRSLALASLVVFMLAGPAAAQVVGGGEVEKRTVQVVNSTHWSRTFAALKDRAQSEKKLIFWLQLVGDLDGGL